MIWRVLKRVFSKPLYWFVALGVSILTLTVMLLLPNYSVLLSVLLSPLVSIISKMAFFGSLYGGLTTNFSVVSAASVILISALFGINAALLMFYIKRARGAGKSGTARNTTVGGIVAATLGIGCAACGSAVVAVVLQLFGVGFITSFLPLHGAEFGLIGVALLLLVTRSLAKKINDPLVCPIED